MDSPSAVGSARTDRRICVLCVERPTVVEGGPGAWTRMPIAQLRYDTAAGTWTLYWADRNRRWHRYDDLDPPQLDDLLKEIDEDPLSAFGASAAPTGSAVAIGW